MPLHPEAVRDFCFIQPCSPILAKAVPAGDGWVHEVKFDGYRVQVHKVGSKVVLYHIATVPHVRNAGTAAMGTTSQTVSLQSRNCCRNCRPER
jgi:hypothetical protein